MKSTKRPDGETIAVAKVSTLVLTASIGVLLFGAACLIFGLVFHAAHVDRELAATMFLIGLPIFLGGIYLTAWQAALCVAAATTGLRWRSLHGWQNASWEQITDFYIYSPLLFGDNWRSTHLVIELEGGRKIRFSMFLQGITALREQVVRNAGERVGEIAWEPLGLRRRDLPQTFTYEPRKIREGVTDAAVMASITTLTFLGLPVLSMCFDKGVPVALLLPLLLMNVYCLRNAWVSAEPYLAARRRLRERFVADAESFTFDDGREAVTVPWKSVIGYDFKNGLVKPLKSGTLKKTSPLKIRTENGQEFAILISLSRLRLWMEIVRKYAVNGIEAKADAERGEALGGIAARWSGGVEGQGDRVFSAWTRSTRAMTFMLGGFGFACIAKSLVNAAFERTFWTLPTLSWLLLPAAITGASMWLAKQIRVQIGRDVLSYLRPWKRETLAWNAIERAEHEGRITTLYRADGSSLRLDTSSLTYGSEIAPLIDERLRRFAPTSVRGSDMP